MKHLFFLLLFFILPLYSAESVLVKLAIKGAIGPASSSHLKEGMAFAKAQNAHIILIELDTPGGLSSSMREMIQDIANSPIPIVSYVSPKGSRAASAGTYILYASHVAAMSSGTNLGAATPVNLMPQSKIMDSNNTKLSSLEKKVINDAMAYIKSLAELNDRNISWALEAVKEGKSLSADDALRLNVIDLMAEDIPELLGKLDGRELKILGKSRVLQTQNLVVLNYEANFKTRILSVITDPNIAYIFLLMAIYGIFFELMNPGGIIPGVIGLISGVIALYALNMIPFNYAGLLLILLGIAFMLGEVLVAGFGVLGIGGVIAFSFGSFLLFDAQTLGSSVSIPLILAFAFVSLAFFLVVMRVFIRSRDVKVRTGIEEMLGSSAEVIEVKDEKYLVHCHGETWNAISQDKLSVGQRVEVIELSGLVLNVKPI